MRRLSAKTLVAQALRDMDIRDGSRRTDAMYEWVMEAAELIGTANVYERKECELTVENFKAELPMDWVGLIGIKSGGSYLEYTGRDFIHFDKGQTAGTEGETPTTPTDLTGSGNLSDRRSFNSQANVNKGVQNGLGKFYIGEGHIHLTQTNGKIGVSYYAFPMDEEGFPLVREDHAVAITAYLIYKYKYSDFINGKLPQGIFQELKQRWQFLCANVRGASNIPDRKRAAYIGGVIWNTLITSPPNELI